MNICADGDFKILLPLQLSRAQQRNIVTCTWAWDSDLFGCLEWII